LPGFYKYIAPTALELAACPCDGRASSYKIRIGLQSGSSMELGFAIRPMVAAEVNRLKLFKECVAMQYIVAADKRQMDFGHCLLRLPAGK
jgi:hypothetical protein